MLNKVILVGRLCNDPELKYTPSGVAVANFRVAVDRPFANSQGEREADFIDTVTWRQNAEFSANYLSKGRLVLVEGRLQVRTWTSAEGQRRRAMEVVADNVRALDRPKEGSAGAGAGAGAAAPAEAVPTPPDEEETLVDPFADQ